MNILIKRAVSLAIASSLTLVAVTAQADSDWSGSFWGINAGAGFNQSDSGVLEFMRVDGSNNTQAINNAFFESFDGKFEAGGIFGLQLGHNWQTDNLVYGVIADISLADLAEEQSAFSATPATYINRREINALATLRGRLGFANNSPVLPFVTAGVAYGDVEYSWEGNSGAFRGDNGDDGSGVGFVVGIGLDIELSDNSTLGAEFLHVDLGSSDFQTRFSGETGGALAAFGNAASGGTVSQGTDDDFSFQTLTVNYRRKF